MNLNEASQIDMLTAHVKRLEARLEEFLADYRATVRALGGCDEALNEHRKLIDTQLADACERLKNIELKFFPNLAGDIENLNGVIGEGDGKAFNPLDRRKR